MRESYRGRLPRIRRFIVSLSLIVLLGTGTAHASAPGPLARAQHWNAVTRMYQAQIWVRYPITRATACAPGCEWSQAINAYHRAVKWRRIRGLYRHPSQALCWALVHRAFRGLPSPDYVVMRESRCEWSAKNPASTASGVFQLLSLHWAGRFDPFDAAANIGYSRRIWARQGGACTAWC